MKLRVERTWKKDTYTVGKLFIDGVFFSNTLEDKDRGLTQNTPLSVITAKKIAGETAIPSGTYTVDMNTQSPAYSKKDWYYTNCNKGFMPRLQKVPGFEGILMHCGNTAKDSCGCILIGKNDVKGGISKSREYFLELYKKLDKANKSGEAITITIE